jgi:F-type H+-transporting ATPase subunit gamma
MAEMLPKQVYVQLYKGLLETSTSEHASRMAAMDNATKNCKEMVQSLTLAYNKARQAAITAELMDIVGGAEALKG